MNSNITVLVVEDEKIARESEEMMLKYSCSGVGRVISASNSIEALKLFQQESPDIVLMDINLPGGNGLDVIRQMKILSDQARYVIVSAYNKFEYAQEAIRQDIVDFLVKPIQVEDLQRVLAGLITEIEARQTQSRHAELQKEKFQTIRPLLENDLICALASLRENISIAGILDFLQMSPVSGAVAVIRGEACTPHFLQNIMKRIQIMGLKCLGGMLGSMGVLVILGETIIQSRQLHEILVYLFHTSAEGQICGSVGKITEPDENLKSSFHQAVFAAQYAEREGRQLLFFDELKNLELPDLMNLQAVSAAITEKIRIGEEQELLARIDSFFGAVQVSLSEEEAAAQARDLYFLVLSELMEQGFSSELFETKKVRKCRSCALLRELMQTDFVAAAELQQISEQGSPGIQGALRIIHAQYMKNITLESVAKEINYTPYYLSRIFKKCTGKTFTEYLSSYRIERSKQLIRDGKLSIKEIAASVGFNSQGYFAKVFKKYTGVSPGEFE